MEFLYPGFLYALSAISIPILIHLFNFRRFKKIQFSNVKFLREIQVQTQSAHKLRHWIILLMRILALAFLVLAFAQPYIPLSGTAVNPGSQIVSVYVDNSFSMDAENEAGNLLEQAKNRAAAIANSYEATDQFQLLTNDFTSRDQRLIKREVFLERLAEVQPGPASRSLNEIYSRQRDLLNSAEGRKVAYLISDFQTAPEKFDKINPDTAINAFLIPLQLAETENLYIDSLWFRTPSRQLGQSEELWVRIGNSGEQNVENVPLNLRINGSQKAVGSFAVKAGTHTDTVLYYVNETPGAMHASVSLQDAPVSFDDQYYFYYQVSNKINVLAIKGPEAGNYFQRIYTPEVGYHYQSVAANEVRYEELANWDLILLNELPQINSGLAAALRDFVSNGGSLYVIPAADTDLNSYSAFAKTLIVPAYTEFNSGKFAVRSIAREHPLFTGVFERIPENVQLPEGEGYYAIRNNTTAGGETLLALRNGDSFLSVFERGAGEVYLAAVPLNTNRNNFARHAMFVTTALRIAELSGSQGALSATIAGNESVTVKLSNPLSGEAVFKLQPLAGQESVIPPFRSQSGKAEIFIPDQIQAAGNYSILLEDSAVSGVGLNYDRAESRLQKISPSQLRRHLDEAGLNRFQIIDRDAASFKAGIVQLDRGREYWQLCLILALAFLGLEVLLLRFWKS